MFATYFAGLDDNLATALALPVQGLHVDLVRAPGQLDQLLAAWPKGRVLSAGVVDGRNVWRADLRKQAALLERAAAKVGQDRLWVAPSDRKSVVVGKGGSGRGVEDAGKKRRGRRS